jgi:hypothetical protein
MNRIAVSLLAAGLLAAPALAEVPANGAPTAAAPAKKPKVGAQKLALAKKPARHRRHGQPRPSAPKVTPAPPTK